MKYKWGFIFICLIVCLFSIASVCASDVNETVVANQDQIEEEISVENLEENNLEKSNAGIDSISSDSEILKEGDVKTGTQLFVDGTVVTLKDSNGILLSDKPVLFDIYKNDEEDNKKIYKYAYFSTDNNGEVEIPTAGIPTGKYYVKITFEGDNEYKSSKRLTSITISRYVEDTLDVDPNSLTALSYIINNAQSGGIINLDKDYSFVSIVNGRTDIPTGIEINKQITINGNGHSIDGRNISQIFNIDANNVVLKNIIFKSGHFYEEDGEYGGAIYWLGDNGKIINCTFRDCRLEDYDSEGYSISSFGGAVVINGENNQISDCIFINNCANYGGAINWASGYCNIVNCRFINNSAVFGGAIYCPDSSSEKGQIVNCEFVNCSASNWGGAIDWEYGNGNVTGCNFTNCHAEEGGAVYWYYSAPIFFECNFMGNTATSGNSIYFNGRNGKIVNSNIEESDINDASRFSITTIPRYTIESSDITVDWGITSYFKVKILNKIDNSAEEGLTVTFLFNGNEFNSITDNEGYAKFAIPIVDAKNYSITTICNMDKVTNVIGINNPLEYMVLYLEQGNYYYNTAEFAVSIYYEKINELMKNQVISLKFSNGKSAKINTGSDAFPICKIKFAPGKYKVKLTFNCAGYSLVKIYKISIKKATPKLTAKAKSFKKSVKSKKYVVYLKDNTGKAMNKVKLTLKIKNKKFTAKTNAKGKATFKIKFTKKGTFKATITHKGNAYYNKVTKNVKIKIK